MLVVLLKLCIPCIHSIHRYVNKPTKPSNDYILHVFLTSLLYSFDLDTGALKQLKRQKKIHLSSTHLLYQLKSSQLSPSNWYSLSWLPFLYSLDCSIFFHELGDGRSLRIKQYTNGTFERQQMTPWVQILLLTTYHVLIWAKNFRKLHGLQSNSIFGSLCTCLWTKCLPSSVLPDSDYSNNFTSIRSAIHRHKARSGRYLVNHIT